ncbi:TetR/AcrR family transcriptional regulator [Streptomyces sp. NPDC055078]
MPKLWSETIEEHRGAVREAVLDAAAGLVAQHGLLSVTMSRIAEATGIGRATLYKYFPDVEAVLTAWHERQINAHLDRLAAVRDGADGPDERLAAVLQAYALIAHERHRHHGSEHAALLHEGEQVAHAHRRLTELIRELLADGVRAGVIRDDIPPGELAAYSLHALGAAGSLPSGAAARRLVGVTLAGLRAGADGSTEGSTVGSTGSEHGG